MLLGMLALSACGVKTTTPDIYNPQTAGLPPGQTGESGSLFTFGKASGPAGSASQIQVNAYLWRATLSTLSFMPLVSADPFGGVVITDWYVPAATPDERFKANAYILGKDLTANNVQVSVFHQLLQDGQWVDAPVDPSVASGLEDRILAQAANLQAAAQNNK
jgi:hypothetical protein